MVCHMRLDGGLKQAQTAGKDPPASAGQEVRRTVTRQRIAGTRCGLRILTVIASLNGDMARVGP